MVQHAYHVGNHGAGSDVESHLAHDSVRIHADAFGIGIEDGNGATSAGSASGHRQVGLDTGLSQGNAVARQHAEIDAVGGGVGIRFVDVSVGGGHHVQRRDGETHALEAFELREPAGRREIGVRDRDGRR